MIRDRGYEAENIPVAYPEMQTDSLEMVIIQGLDWLMQHYKRPLIADDSGLFIDALAGFPGVYSAYAYKTIGLDGILRLLEGVKDRSARFECCIGFMMPGGEPSTCKGIAKGSISMERAGTGGFGYDPVFIPEGYAKTYAQFEISEKNKISHRGLAIGQFINRLPLLMK